MARRGVAACVGDDDLPAPTGALPRQLGSVESWRPRFVSPRESHELRTPSYRHLGRACTQLELHDDDALPHLRDGLPVAERDGDRVEQAQTHWAIADAWESREMTPWPSSIRRVLNACIRNVPSKAAVPTP